MGNTTLAGRTVIISGGSRGIGLAIGVAAAKQGANVVLLAKTDAPHRRLPGTVHTAAADVEAAGGKALAVVGDVRSEEDVQRAVEAAVQRFGGIDRTAREATGNCYVDAEVLQSSGVSDLSRYGGGQQPIPDLFLD